MEDDNHGQSE
jgi:hypothetical protein